MVIATRNKSNEMIPYATQFTGTSYLATLSLIPLLSAITLPLTNGPTSQTNLTIPQRAVQSAEATTPYYYWCAMLPSPATLADFPLITPSASTCLC